MSEFWKKKERKNTNKSFWKRGHVEPSEKKRINQIDLFFLTKSGDKKRDATHENTWYMITEVSWLKVGNKTQNR